MEGPREGGRAAAAEPPSRAAGRADASAATGNAACRAAAAVEGVDDEDELEDAAVEVEEEEDVEVEAEMACSSLCKPAAVLNTGEACSRREGGTFIGVEEGSRRGIQHR